MSLDDAALDGTDAELPDRQAAMEEYRALWARYLMALAGSTEDERERLRRAMDRVQCRIAHGPGPIWRAFRASLPGFEAYWQGWREDTLQAGRAAGILPAEDDA